MALKTFGDVQRWARLAVEFSGTAILSAVAIGATILPERMYAAGGVPALVIAAWFAIAVFVLSVFYVRQSAFRFNPVFVFLQVLGTGLDLKKASLTASAQIAGAFAGVIIAQYGLNLDPVQAPDPGHISLPRALAEGTAGLCFGALSIAGFVPKKTTPLSSPRSLEAVGQTIPNPHLRTLNPGALLSEGRRRWRMASFASWCKSDKIGGALSISALSFVFIAFGPGIVFGNPAITLARTLTTNALGLSPLDAFMAALANLVGASASWLWLKPQQPEAPIEL